MTNEEQIMEIKISGMTCPSCEDRVQAAIAGVEGVISVKVDQSRGRASVTIDPQILTREQALLSISLAVKNAGYSVKGLVLSQDRASLPAILGIAAVMVLAFLFANSQGWFNFLPTIDSSVGLGMIFIAGLLTSVHCVAMCGGIVLSQQARVSVAAVGQADTPQSRFRATARGLQYHLGRVVSYTILGAIVGAIGSVISFSPLTKGILAGIAGLFMVAIGLRMLGLLPRLTTIRLPRLNRLINPKIGAALRGRGPFVVGLLNGFMPCGPLQTMQLYALGTGSFLLGALSMFLFSLGTVPLLFAFGAMSSFFTVRWQQRLVRASAVLVVLFGVVMAGRALDLSGASGMIQTMTSRIGGSDYTVGALETPVSGGSGKGGSSQGRANATTATIKDGVQYVSFDLAPNSYAPITVQKGVPVRWTINATAENLNGCNSEIQIPQLKIRKKLTVGANIIEFTPPSSGVISYTCWMGMINSSIKVVDSLGGGSSGAENPSQPELAATGSGSCCAGDAPAAFANGKIPVDRIGLASFKTEKGQKIQEVTVMVDDTGYTPAVLVLQKNIPTRIKFLGAKLSGCNQQVVFPEYNGALDLGRGETETPLLPVSRDFSFQCGMNMLHAYVRVVDDLSKLDRAELKATVAAWKPEAGASRGMSCCGQ